MKVADLTDTSVRAYYYRLGILQYGDDSLRRPSAAIDLVAERELAKRIWRRLSTIARRVMTTYDFTRGIGLAAPQIGMPYRIALVRPSPDSHPLCLCNPQVLSTSSKQLVETEGCLSFFEVRGYVRRPEWIEVKYQRLSGDSVVQRFEGEVARLVCHEIDHLDGILYVDRMSPRDKLIPAPNSFSHREQFMKHRERQAPKGRHGSQPRGKRPRTGDEIRRAQTRRRAAL